MSRIPKSVIATAIVLAVLSPAVSAMAATAPTNQYHLDHRETPKLVFAPEFVARGVTDPEAIAQRYVAAEGERYKLPADADELRLEDVRQSLLGTHVRYQQYLNGIPVEGAEFIVSVAKDGSILKVYNTSYPVIRRPETSKAKIGTSQALDIAWADLRVHGDLLDMAPTSKLVYLPQGMGFRLVYLTRTDVAAPFGGWQHTIDATTGEVLGVERIDIPRKKVGTGKLDFAAYDGAVLDRATAEQAFRARAEANKAAADELRATVDGTGQVFDPDPKTTLANAALLDTSPAATFNPAYFTKTLSDITETSGTYSLSGPWVHIIDFESPNTAPSTTSDGIWTAVRGNNAFNDTNTYFQIDQNQRYMQSLGFTGGTAIQDGPIGTDTDGFGGDDNSHYFPGSNQLGFGHGGVDDDEDVDVILHEYMHGITHDINPSWGGADTGAMGEGFGDYWGGSYSYSTPNGPTFHPEWAFSWDGHGTDTWSGRVMNVPPASSQYDPSCTYAAHSTCGGVDGDTLWSTPIFQAFLTLVGGSATREEVDTIILESQFGLGSSVTMPDMANAIVAAAQSLYPAGAHANVFQTKFSDHNILDLPAVAAASFTYPTGGSVVPAGATVNVTWDTGGAPGTAEYALEYTDQCTPAVTFADDMESGGAAWSVSHPPGTTVDWSLVTTSPHSGTTSWFASEPTSVADQYVAMAGPVVISAGGQLSFWHSYNLETGYDGGVVEISTNSGSTWTDLGSDIIQNGYGGTISTSYQSPIGGRQAFTGSSSGYIQTIVDLSSYAGSSAIIRFRMATDSSSTATGWWVDDVSIATTGTWNTIGTSAAGASSMPWNVPIDASTDYCLRITATAPGYSASQTQGAVFEVQASSIFADDFESSNTAAWSTTVP
jgi:Zn-dependent metalloprotease